VANAAPYSTHYPGTSLQTDTDPEVLRLERPVRISSPIPSVSGAAPLTMRPMCGSGQVIAPAVKPTTTSVRFSRLFTENEISYGPFLSVPVSEIALFLHSDDVNYVHTYNNTAVSYDTFDSLSITSAFSLLVEWDWRFLWATYIVSRTPPGSGRWALSVGTSELQPNGHTYDFINRNDGGRCGYGGCQCVRQGLRVARTSTATS
jgi:hypothetical protein